VYAEHIREQLGFLPYVPVMFISAKKGLRVTETIDLAIRVFEERSYRIKTRDLIDLVKRAQFQHNPASGPRHLKIKHVTQAKGYPPTFTFFVNDLKLMREGYKRYLEGKIREFYPFVGTPIIQLFRQNTAKPKLEPPK
jgi:GTP-binding protein